MTAGDREVTLSWEPPADNGNAPATRYRVEWRVDGKDYTSLQWGTSRSTTYTTPGQANLANGVKYFFRVKAENGSGSGYGPYGPASEEVSATPTSGSAVDLGTPVLSELENLHHGMVRLDWEDIEDAGWYVVQYYHLEGGEWLDLPAVGVGVAFHGSSAVVGNLDYGIHWLRVRAMSCAGSSEWSQIEQLSGTSASDWEGVPVPEVEEGDEIGPCPVVLGTPVLSELENLHHGMVRLDWQDIEDAGWYVVQYYHIDGGSGEWLDLPAVGVGVAFHGSSAVVGNLDYGIHLAEGWCGELCGVIGVVPDRAVVRNQRIGLGGCARTRGGGGRRDRTMLRRRGHARQQPCHRSAHHRWHGAGGRDADGVHMGDRRC